MPAWDILKALNMTPQDWGKIASEEERARLRRKALAIIAKAQPASVHDQLAELHSQVAQLVAEVKRLSAAVSKGGTA